jgi:tousled-like kinase
VACKIHQLNPNWSDTATKNYIKHALRENEIVKELSHPNIVSFFETVEIDNSCFCTVLEYCDGPDLSHYMKQNKTISERHAKNIIKQVVAGIHYINSHATKVIHYDLKPQNLLFHNGSVKIADFGLCKVNETTESKMDLTSQGVGTYWYLPPECFVKGECPPKISHKVDVWSIGVIFFEMLYGQKPFGNGVTQEKVLAEGLILKATTVNFPPKPQVSSEAKEFIRNCLKYHQDERYDIVDCHVSTYLKHDKLKP